MSQWLPQCHRARTGLSLLFLLDSEGITHWVCSFFWSYICCSCFMETPSESKAERREGCVTTRKSRQPFVPRCLHSVMVQWEKNLVSLSCAIKRILGVQSQEGMLRRIFFCLAAFQVTRIYFICELKALIFSSLVLELALPRSTLVLCRPGAGPCSALLQSRLPSAVSSPMQSHLWLWTQEQQ